MWDVIRLGPVSGVSVSGAGVRCECVSVTGGVPRDSRLGCLDEGDGVDWYLIEG